MASYAEYFAARDADKSKPKYVRGDRVFGRWNQIPFIASVIREEDKNILVQTDLPITYNNAIHNILKVSRNDVKRLVNFDDGIVHNIT
jgi:hypothetical protein